METIRISDSRTVIITSGEGEQISRSYLIDGHVRLIIILNGRNETSLNLQVEVSAGSVFTMLLINHNEQALQLNDSYRLLADSNSTIAYCQLNNFPLNVNSRYDLAGEGAVLKVQNATVTSVDKQFYQYTEHSERHTSAQINNYGIVMKRGFCNFDVRNRINKGCHGSETHQTSRILTFDPKSRGKILPVLYIDDNDVKASHAATMGQPEADQIFYMQTRGLSRDDALRLITIGYLLPITEVVKDDEELRQKLTEEIESKVNQCLK